MRGSRLLPYGQTKSSAFCVNTGRSLYRLSRSLLFFIVCVMSSFTGRRAEGHGRVIRRLDMKEQRFFVIMQIQLYVKLYFTAISDLLQF